MMQINDPHAFDAGADDIQLTARFSCPDGFPAGDRADLHGVRHRRSFDERSASAYSFTLHARDRNAPPTRPPWVPYRVATMSRAVRKAAMPTQ